MTSGTSLSTPDSGVDHLGQVASETARIRGRQGRVLFVTSNYPRWAGDSTTPFVLHLAQDLQGLGWQVDVLAPHAPGARRREVMDGIRVERFRYLWPPFLQTLCYRGGALMNLRKSPLTALQLPAFLLVEWLATMSRLASRRYDLLHSHWILPQGFTGALAARPLGIPHIVTVHGSDVFALRGRLFGMFKRFALRRATAVTVNSSATGKAASQIAGTLARLRRIPMGVSDYTPSSDSAPDSRRKHCRGNGPRLIFVGRVVEEKGVADLIRAVALVARRLPEVTAVILGEGRDRVAMQQLTEELGLAERITFTGWVDPEQVPHHCAAADIFVGPSWLEGQGLAFAEALRAGTPVIATAVGGIVDLIRHDETGLLVPVASPQEIAAAIERLAGDPALAARLTAAGAELVQKEFTRATTARAFSNLYGSLLPVEGNRA